mmetsp:Transcript_13412/g.27296  ORF Transcript_13412/g.27296 Transcript_13412/m.27296 type:complete len:83 (+) Transcript_13412:4526-4774(+)
MKVEKDRLRSTERPARATVVALNQNCFQITIDRLATDIWVPNQRSFNATRPVHLGNEIIRVGEGTIAKNGIFQAELEKNWGG